MILETVLRQTSDKIVPADRGNPYFSSAGKIVFPRVPGNARELTGTLAHKRGMKRGPLEFPRSLSLKERNGNEVEF